MFAVNVEGRTKTEILCYKSFCFSKLPYYRFKQNHVIVDPGRNLWKYFNIKLGFHYLQGWRCAQKYFDNFSYSMSFYCSFAVHFCKSVENFSIKRTTRLKGSHSVPNSFRYINRSWTSRGFWFCFFFLNELSEKVEEKAVGDIHVYLCICIHMHFLLWIYLWADKYCHV